MTPACSPDPCDSTANLSTPPSTPRLGGRWLWLALLVAILLLPAAAAHAVCCSSNNSNMCADGSCGTPYCGNGGCNVFGCNCDGGCRTGPCTGCSGLAQGGLTTRDHFNLIDLSEDGSISLAEFVRWARSSAAEAISTKTRDQLAKEFAQLDTNRNQKIEPGEFDRDLQSK